MPRNPDKKPCTVSGCNAWAIRGSDPPRCSPHSRMVGAPNEETNHPVPEFYATAVHPEELADLTSYACNPTLVAEIAITRIALRRVFGMLVTGQTPGPSPRPLEAQDYARFVGLAFQGAGTISRLLRANHAVGGDQPSEFEQVMDAALDQLSTMWGVEL
jgi:hypothetical protein